MKKIAAITLCIMFFGVGGVYAQPLQRHTFEIGTEIYYKFYEEPDVMQENGMMYGLVGSYTYHNKLMFKLEGRGSWGQMAYSNSGNINGINDYLLEARALVGYDFPILKVHSITPYLGGGYRYLNDNSAGRISTTGARGYERESNYFYSPIGIEAIANVGKTLSLREVIEFDYFWMGIQKSHLSDAVVGYNDIINTQKKGYGLRGSITLHITGKKIDFEIGPFIKYWSIEESETDIVTYFDTPIAVGFEPTNYTIEAGIMGSIKF
jgi:hypothetical protein